MKKRKHAILLLVLLVPVAGYPSGAATPTEYQVKAAFLYYFAKFVEWPAGIFPHAGSPIQIGILGEDPFDIELDQTLHGKSANGRELSVKRSLEVAELKDCHIVFISPAERDRLPYILDSLRGLSVLTVSETSGFIEQGGVINFVMTQKRIQFEINLQSATRAKLKISSKLLNVAKNVKE